MGRSPCCEKVGLKKGPWTSEEDEKLREYIEEHGHGSWRALPSKAGLQRCGKSCRLRWTNYLRPDIKRGKFSLQEEQTIIQLHALLGNRWSAIANHLPKRTDNEIKNYWNTHLKKRLTKMGIDPVTHKPKTDSLCGGGSGNPKDAANLSHMAQWESARLEAEARLVRESKQVIMVSNINNNQAPLITRNATNPPPCLDVLKAWQLGTWSSTKTITRDHNNNITLSSLVAMDDLESPTSTLNFQDSSNNNNKNNNPLLYPSSIQTTSTTTLSGFSESEVAGALEFAKLTSNIPYGCCIENINGYNGNSSTTTTMDHETLQDITYGTCCNENNAAWFSEAGNENMELGGFTDHHRDRHDHVLVYNSNQDQQNNSSILVDIGSTDDQGDEDHGNGISCGIISGNFEENNKIYWNSILNLVNASASGSPVF